ncbi:ATP-grasp domain-containing protein [Kitasatospora sp. LaBMicrA B282]|uniref:ATP-grasp domain-containing protein n=1 Tax=Kitasatospora sp. LaBMicrA B282 TaxID=3420949 RepID=UPI003D11A238
MTRIAVVYDYGAVNAAEIMLGLGPVGDPVFVGSASEHTGPLLPLLAELGDVVRLEQGFEAVVGQLAELGVDAIVTYSDEMLELTARLAERLGLAFHSMDTVQLLRDKSRQRQRLREAGVEQLRTGVIHDPADWPAVVAAVGLPAVLKPARGRGSRDTHLITDPEQGRQLVTRFLGTAEGADRPVFVLEEYLVGRPCGPFGDYVAVETVCTADGYRHLPITGKFPLLPPFRETGGILPAVLNGIEADAVTDLVSRALGALGVVIGITHTEVKLTADGPRLIEVNGRMGGYVNDTCRAVFGFDFVELSAELALGRTRWTPPPEPDRVHFQWRPSGPVQAFTLKDVLGIEAVRELPGVTSYRPMVEAGESRGPSVATRHLDTVSGVVDSYEEMFETVRQVGKLLAYEFTFADGRTTRLTSGDLLTHPITPLTD